MEGSRLKQSKKQKLITGGILGVNLVLVSVAVLISALYSSDTRKTKNKKNLDSFVNSVESLKRLSQNYISSEIGYANNWANYISSHPMDMEGALDFVRDINTNENRFVHIVDMDDFTAHSSYYEKGSDSIQTYLQYMDVNGTDYIKSVKRIMIELFDGTSNGMTVLGKYTVPEKGGIQALSVGGRVTIRTKENTDKDYLLLRVIPIDDIKKTWVFPTSYASAEIGIITKMGDYVIQSNSMKSNSFLEFIRGYNFQDDYNRVLELEIQIRHNDNEILYFNNSRNQPCVFYYSSFGDDSELDILGMIPVSSLEAGGSDWLIALVLSGTLLFLALIDGYYAFRINKALKVTAMAAKKANNAKSDFLSAMSHDIRTPLNAVIGMNYAAMNHLDDEEYARSCLEKSTNAGKQLISLINDVLDISKIESGNLNLFYAPLSLKETAEEISDSILPMTQEKGIQYEEDLSKVSKDIVYADKSRLIQVCLNLLSNAVKYTPKGGKIHFAFEEENLPEKDMTSLKIIVSDNGIGMSEEYQRKMYDAFTRAVTTQVNKTQGTGLGLYIVKKVVSAMGGTLDCKSAINEGTTFTLRFKLKWEEKPVEEEEEKQSSFECLLGKRMLVAEDNLLNQEIIKTVLKENGIDSDLTENGKLCIEKLEEMGEDYYDCVILDVHMPVMDGLEAAREIRKRGYKIPMIAMTADAFDEDVRNCLASGMNGHVAKPVDVRKLLETLKKLTVDKDIAKEKEVKK